MKSIKPTLLGLMIMAAQSGLAPSAIAAQQTAETILTNAVFYTGQPVKAVAIGTCTISIH